MKIALDFLLKQTTMNTANRTERKFLQALIRGSKSLDYKIDHPWEVEQNERQKKTSGISKEKLKNINILIKIVSAYYGISVADIRGHSRKRKLVPARYIFCHIAHRRLFVEVQSIGFFLGGRDHSTICHAVNQAIEKIEFNEPNVTEEIRELTELYHRTFK